MGLAAYLQNVLNQMAPAPAPAPPPPPRHRKRRQIENMNENMDDPLPPNSGMNANTNTTMAETHYQDRSDIVTKLVPVLSVVGFATDRLIPVNCTFRSICKANKMMVDDFGDVGRSVAAIISTELGKMLMSPEPRRGPVTLRQVQKVAQIGRNGLPCNILFKDCEELSFLPKSYLLPPPPYLVDNDSQVLWDNPILRKSGMTRLLLPLQKRKGRPQSK